MRKILFCAIVVIAASSLDRNLYAQQAPQPPWGSAVVQYYARVKECWERYDRKELRTFGKTTDCADHDLVSSLDLARYPAMDLVRYIAAEHQVIAEQVDNKKLTAKQGRAKWVEIDARVRTELEQRKAALMARAKAEAEARAAAQVERDAQARAQARQDAQLQAILQMQAQAAADAEAARRLQMLDLAGRMLSPQYYGAPRVQTTCQWVGPQFMCY